MVNMLYFCVTKTLASLRSDERPRPRRSIQYGCVNTHSYAMSPKRWILLLIFYVSYLMFGASIYYHIEHGVEKNHREEQLRERIEINEYLVEQLAGKNESTQTEVLEKITDYCGKPVTNYTLDEFEPPYVWTFYHSFFFAFTVCSTVGYGNISPNTFLGRMIMIVYSVIGIPVNGILFAGLGEYFGKTFEAIYRRYKKYKITRNKYYVPPQLGLVTIIVIALIPGITIFMLLPSWLFTYFEGWDYSISLYYSYVTMTTIGFGDYVPTFGEDQPRRFGGWFVVYEIFIIFWFIFSLGYLVMIMTFITRGLQSKKLARLEQQLSTNIKATQNRIWTGVTKDVGYFRRILNELYILRVKPVYTEPDPSLLLHRSNSCPELSMYRVEPPPEFSRKRAFSECYDVIEARITPMHASSDTELDKLDKQKSFHDADAFRHTTELLAKVVSALSTVRPPPPEEDSTLSLSDIYGGYHGFSDSQILASEWSYPSINEPPRPRDRACSDFNIDPKWRTRRPTGQANEWTWSGDNNQIQEAINIRCKQNGSPDLYRSSFGRPPREFVVNIDDEELQKPRAKKFSMPDGLRRLFPFKKRPSQDGVSVANDAAAAAAAVKTGRKFSIMSVPETHQIRAPPLDYYSTVTANANNTNLSNGKPTAYPSDGFLAAKPVTGAMNGGLGGGAGPRRGSVAADAYQRNAASGARKRRESIFTQNPALNARRASMFPSTSAAGLTQRRGSLFSTGAPSNSALPPRRGSLFPPNAARLSNTSNGRRPSLFSVASEEDREVLENTTIADLIRALEAVHTQAVLDDANSSEPVITHNDMGGIFGSDAKKRRKVGTAGLDPPEIPPLLSLFAGDNSRALSTAAANRLYARRSTIVGTLPCTSFNAPTSTITNTSQSSGLSTGPTSVLTRRRKSSAVQIVEPPPSYSEHDTNVTAAPAATSGVISKFKRRFSVRPTALQIPPGKAPPPGVSISNVASTNIQTVATPTAAAAAAASTTASAPQTVLQRRLSLRPSPLARELNISTASSGTSSSGDPSPTSPTSGATISSITRLLPAAVINSATATPSTATTAGVRPLNTGSTHSPLSRSVQIAQAQRKSVMPEGFTLERTKKPDGGK